MAKYFDHIDYESEDFKGTAGYVGKKLIAIFETVKSVGIASGEVLAAKTNRLYALITNDSDTVIYLSLGGTAVLSKGIRLTAAGGTYEISHLKGNRFIGAITAICVTSGKKLLIEST